MSSYHGRKMLSIDMSIIIVSCILAEFIPLKPCQTGLFKAVRFLLVAIIFALFKVGYEIWIGKMCDQFYDE